MGVEIGLAQAAADEAWREAHYLADLKPSASGILWRAGANIYGTCLLHGADAVVIVCGQAWHPQHTILLRRAQMKVGILMTESPYMDVSMADNLALADIVWTNERVSVQRLHDLFEMKGQNTPVRYLRHAYHPRWHRPLSSAPDPKWDVPDHDVLFVGTGFQERVDLLRACDWTGIDLALYGHWSILRMPRLMRLQVATATMRRIRLLGLLARFPWTGTDPLWRYIKGWVSGRTRTTDLYRHAKININLFRSSAKYWTTSSRVLVGESMGPRCYELAACGAFMISEYRPEIPEMFGDLVPTFKTPDEMMALIRYYLANPIERERRAALLPSAVSGHDWITRARQVATDLAGLAASSPIRPKEFHHARCCTEIMGPR